MKLQLLDEVVDAVKLGRYVDLLRAVLYALPAAYTVAGLSDGRDAAVVAYEEAFPCLAVLARLGVAGGHFAFGDAFVVVVEDDGDVEAVGAGHAVVAGGAGNGLQLDKLLGDFHQELVLLGRDGAQGRVGGHVLHEVLHIGHAAQHGEDAFGGAGVAEGPAGHGGLGLTLFHLLDDEVGLVGQSPSEQGLHNDTGDAATVQLFVEIGGVDVVGIDAVGVVPVDVVHLNLDEIPMVAAFVVPL